MHSEMYNEDRLPFRARVADSRYFGQHRESQLTATRPAIPFEGWTCAHQAPTRLDDFQPSETKTTARRARSTYEDDLPVGKIRTSRETSTALHDDPHRILRSHVGSALPRVQPTNDGELRHRKDHSGSGSQEELMTSTTAASRASGSRSPSGASTKACA